MMEVTPVTLFGKIIHLEPLSEVHVPDLTVAGQDESIWRYMLYGTIKTESQMRAWVQEILSRQDKGTDLPFAIISLDTGRAVGATRYMEIRPKDRGLEIGGTWIQVDYQRTPINTESKYLLLKHAFETLECIRVQFKTDLRNERSQRAIERLGAIKEGVFRKHMITPEGFIRDSVFYSIVDSDWIVLKARLEAILGI